MISTWSGTASVNACGDCAAITAGVTELAAVATPPAPAPTAAPMAAPSPPPAMAPIAAPIAAPPTTFLVPVPLPPAALTRLGLDRQNPVADFHVGERHAEGGLALHLAAVIHRAHDAVDFRAARRDQAPVGREILIEESLDAISDVRRGRAHVGGESHDQQRTVGDNEALFNSLHGRGWCSAGAAPAFVADAAGGAEAGAVAAAGGAGGRSTITYSSLPSAERYGT